MRRFIKTICLLSFVFFGFNQTKAQLYDLGVGGQVDMGVGEALVGINVKYMPFQYLGLEFSGGYGNGFTALQFVPQFVYTVSEQTDGLAVYAGAGPSIIMGAHANELSVFNIVGVAGAEFELVDYPISFFGEWRPRMYQKDPGYYNTMQIKKGLEPGRFSFGIRYTF